jgi:hypothetical protein
MSSASPYPFSHNKVVPMIFGALTLLPVSAAPTVGLLPSAVSAIGQQLDLQRATSSTLIDEIEEKVGYTYYPDVIVPLPPPTMTLVGTVTFVQSDLKMPESADDYPYLT